jgi:hypothetical protein
MAYTKNYATNSNNNRYNAGSTAPSDAQKMKYFELCTERKIQPKDTSTLTRQEMSKLIEETLKFRPMTQGQRDKLNELIAQLQSAGKNVAISDEKLASMNVESASKAIDYLNEHVRGVTHLLPPTEKQLEILLDWMFCPDVPFESISRFTKEKIKTFDDDGIEVTREVESTETVCISPMKTILIDGTEHKRAKTREEFADDLTKLLKRQEASKLIEEYRGAVTRWNQTRATQGQRERIVELQDRMNRISKGGVREEAVDISGDIIDLGSHLDSRARQEQEVGYEGMEAHQLIQLTREEASLWIDQLSKELRHMEDYQADSDLDFVGSTDERIIEEEEGIVRRAQTRYESAVREYEAFNNFTFAVESMTTFPMDEVRDVAQLSRVDAIGGIALHISNVDLVKDTIRYLFEQEALSLLQMAQLVDRSEFLTEIVNSLVLNK